MALTALDVATSDDAWAGFKLNILFSFALLRLVAPVVERAIMPRQASLVLLVVATLALIRPLEPYLEYGMEGWLWAYFGLAHRMVNEDAEPRGRRAALHRAVAIGLIAALAYIAAESFDYELTWLKTAVLAILVAALVCALLTFKRRISSWQPAEWGRRPLRFAGRHSFALYGLSLAGMQITSFLINGHDV